MLEKLLGNRICHHGQKRMEKKGKNARNATEFLIFVDLGKVWPPLIGAIRGTFLGDGHRL